MLTTVAKARIRKHPKKGHLLPTGMGVKNISSFLVLINISSKPDLFPQSMLPHNTVSFHPSRRQQAFANRDTIWAILPSQSLFPPPFFFKGQRCRGEKHTTRMESQEATQDKTRTDTNCQDTETQLRVQNQILADLQRLFCGGQKEAKRRQGKTKQSTPRLLQPLRLRHNCSV